MATKKKSPKAVAAKKAAPAKSVVAKAAAPKKAVVPKAAPKKKVVAKLAVAEKGTALEKIAAIQAQVDELKKEAVAELKEKLVVARKVVRILESDLKSLTV